MKALVTAKVGMFLAIASVLAVWTFLAVQPVQAHTLTDPSCGGLPTAADFFETAETAALNAGATVSATATPKKGTGRTGEGRTAHYYARITLPALTAGELMVTGNSADTPSEAALCRGSSQIASSRPSYASAHNSANSAADTAATAAAAARETNASESTAKSALRTAARALTDAATALTNLATTLTNAGEDPAAATAAAATATSDAATATGVADAAADNSATDEAGALETAATRLDAAATALGAEMVFEPINVLISSGTEEYVVVVTIPADDTDDVDALTVDFKGVMATSADAQNGQDGGSFTANNQRITHTLMTTDPGLLTVRTTGSAVDTKGTLNDGATRIAMDEGSRGNFEIISPAKTDTTYTLQVEAQSRSARGDYGLDMEFGVAVDLGADATNDTGIPGRNDELASGRADYFFFETAATTYRFMTVETLKHPDATPETNTAGAFFSQQGLVATDADGGAGANFALTAPVSQGLYIVEVTGTSAGEYVLKVTSRAATSRGSAPDMLTATPGTAQTLAAEGVVPYSIDVTAPGTLQVKTTGMIDTIGTLYGPDGRAIAEDDNSGDGVNFKITEAVGVGQHIVVVEGQTRTTTGDYTLVVNFVEGATVDGPTTPTTPGTGTETEEQLREQIADLRDDLDACLMPVVTDARGTFENPSGGGYRSGVGLISGWVCAAEEVEVRIYTSQGSLVRTLDVAYGTSRPDTVGRCRHNSPNTGFGMTYNFNHLPEGTYTIRAYADGTDNQIGQDETFEVTHLTEFEATDDDRFLRLPDDVQARGECVVNDFPATGEDTYLRWEQSIQNFVIEDAG